MQMLSKYVLATGNRTILARALPLAEVPPFCSFLYVLSLNVPLWYRKNCGGGRLIARWLSKALSQTKRTPHTDTQSTTLRLARNHTSQVYNLHRILLLYILSRELARLRDSE